MSEADASGPKDGGRTTAVFVARQPIFDKGRVAVAHELLFRSAAAGPQQFPEGSTATARVMLRALVDFGLERLVPKGAAYVNVTERVLLDGLARLLPPERVVLEVLEDVPATADVLLACRRLKDDGYTLAIDDVTSPSRFDAFRGLADVVKVDFALTSERERRRIAERVAPSGARLLAEKVETYEELALAEELDYELFQGFFFAKPETLTATEVTPGRLGYLQLVKALRRPGLDVDGVEEVIKQDLSLSFRLLRYLNSAHFALRAEVRSIRHALVLLGKDNVRKWATLVVMASLGEGKPPALITTSMTRGRFCELLAGPVGLLDYADELFLTGLFSTLGALVDRPTAEVLAGMSLAQPITEALIEGSGLLGEVLQLALLYERGRWDDVATLAKELSVPGPTVAAAYFDATAWAVDAASAV